MNGSKLLIPAVMLTASLGAFAKLAPVPTLAHAAQADAPRVLTPAVMGTRAPDNYPVPQRLQDYSDSMSKGVLVARPCQGIRCGSTSGSGNGWDDSDQ